MDTLNYWCEKIKLNSMKLLMLAKISLYILISGPEAYLKINADSLNLSNYPFSNIHPLDSNLMRFYLKYRKIFARIKHVHESGPWRSDHGPEACLGSQKVWVMHIIVLIGKYLLYQSFRIFQVKKNIIWHIHKRKPWRLTIFSTDVHYNRITMILNWLNPNTNITDFISKIVIFA